MASVGCHAISNVFRFVPDYHSVIATPMQAKWIKRQKERLTGLGLWISVHRDAVCTAPRAYLAALWWRLRGKRVRARYRFAPLLGGAPKAYKLWMWQEGNQAETEEAFSGEAPIWAIIDASAGDARSIEVTLHSLAIASVPALMVGTADTPTLADVAQGIDWAKAPWLMPLVAGDRIAHDTLATYAAVIDGTQARVIYADDDLITETGERYRPHFKPDWNSELFRYFDYLSGACIVRAERKDLEGLAVATNWMDLLIKQAVGTGAVVHLPRILHHRRARPLPHVPAAPERSEDQWPSVSIIVPTRNRLDLLQTCLAGIAATDYPDIETIIVDNDSDEPQTLSYLAGLDPARYKVLHHGGAFNYSAINNHAVAQARGHLLCLLNNDIEVIEPGWLQAMVVQALRKDVGAVGARLLYPDGRIQHAGVVLHVGGGAAHAHRLLHPADEGYFYRHALPQFVSAVTAACLVVDRHRFLEVGGFDERNFAVAFNDVDLCLRLNQCGWQSFYEPRATLIHYESVSRGFDRDPVGAARFAKEFAALQALWNTDRNVDPFHHPQLSPASEQFVVRL